MSSSCHFTMSICSHARSTLIGLILIVPSHFGLNVWMRLPLHQKNLLISSHENIFNFAIMVTFTPLDFSFRSWGEVLKIMVYFDRLVSEHELFAFECYFENCSHYFLICICMCFTFWCSCAHSLVELNIMSKFCSCYSTHD